MRLAAAIGTQFLLLALLVPTLDAMELSVKMRPPGVPACYIVSDCPRPKHKHCCVLASASSVATYSGLGVSLPPD
ncbi:hypothetical protein B0H19DRAFT_1130625 [Mycena capillaripes]|nr:hypothetical protein B0H19DRAFT_1130625 [Mycena capillaripes]